MYELERAALKELQILVDIHIKNNDLDAAAKVLIVVEALERRINTNVIQMSGWEPAAQPIQNESSAANRHE